eukprot:gene19788-25728_t
MEAEAQHFLSELQLTPKESIYNNSPFKIFTGFHNGAEVSVVTNGKDKTFGVDNVGTVPAAIATFATINQLKPDIIVNAGTAGGYKAKGAAIGDVFISETSYNHDRRIPIPGFLEYGKGGHKSPATPNLIKALNFKSGNVSTGNSLDHTPTDDELILANDASVKDMEAAAIAWTADLSSTPFLALKVVTDIVDGDRPSHEEFLENLSAASRSLQNALPKLIDFVIGKKIEEL